MTSLAKVLTVHKRSGRPSLARYRHFKTILDATGANCPFATKSSGAISASSIQGVATFFKVPALIFAISMYRSTHCSAAPRIVYSQPRTPVGVAYLLPGVATPGADLGLELGLVFLVRGGGLVGV